jgi:hypothetical protein
MMPTHSSRGLVGCVAIALLAFAPVVLLGSPAAMGAARDEGRLSPRLSLLAKPAVRSGSNRAQARGLGVPVSGPGSLLREGNRVLTEVRFSRGATAGAVDLREAGAAVVGVSPRYKIVTAAIRPDELGKLSNVPNLAAVTEVLAPSVAGAGDPVSAAITTPCFGEETSEGDEQLRAAQARAEFGVDGSGVKVGILSDSFDRDAFTPTGAAEDTLSGDLPGAGNPCGRETPVEVLSDPEKKGEDEGRAMAQIVHDLAPGAELSFATAFKGLTNFASNVKALVTAGANVITDDVAYFEEPFFQEGPVGVAVKEATEAGVSYFSSAGNNNLKNGGGKNIASWEAPEYRDANGCPAAIVNFSQSLEGEGEPGLNPAHCMDFDPSGGVDRAFRVTVSNGATLVVDLQWAEPWEGVATNLDAFLLGPKGSVVSASFVDNVHGSKKPFELVSWENETGAAADVQIVINRFEGSADPRLKFALLQNGGGVTSTEEFSGGEDVVGPTIFGHNGAEKAISVGAVPYDSEEAPEVYSSRGPVTHYFGPVTGTGPALPLGPQLLAKPDMVATDGGANTFFGSCDGEVRRFFGTSASAPHAAAVAALIREAEPAANAEAVEKAMKESARPVGSFPATAIGSGLIDAVGALEKLGVVASEPGAEVAEPPAPGPCLPPREPAGGTQSHSIETLPTPTPPIEPPVRASRPRTFFLQRPAKVVRTVSRRAKVVFLFGSDQPGVSFACRIDGGLFRRCSPRLVRRFPLGWHTVKVAALDAAGIGDKTPASYRFKVKRVR